MTDMVKTAIRFCRAASSSGGRKVIRISPAEPSPGDAPAGIPVHSPVPRPGNRRHDIEPVRPPVVARPVTPRPSAVLHLDPEAVPADLGAQGERAAAARGAVQDGVGGELRRDQNRLVHCYRTNQRACPGQAHCHAGKDMDIGSARNLPGWPTACLPSPLPRLLMSPARKRILVEDRCGCLAGSGGDGDGIVDVVAGRAGAVAAGVLKAVPCPADPPE
jgi:hypothetical protein